jgi:hypothetical protein
VVETSQDNSPGPGQFEQTDGQVVSADEAYERLHDTGEPKPLRAALELGVMLGGGTAWYWITREQNARDWDATDLAGRLNGRDWRIDNNGLDVNFFYHGLSGTAYYGIARANHLSMPLAYAYAFTSSFLWDFALEYNERISISEVIVTPSAGLVFAEYLHKLSWYLNGVPERPTATQRVMRWTPIGASVAIHRAWDGADDPVVQQRTVSATTPTCTTASRSTTAWAKLAPPATVRRWSTACGTRASCTPCPVSCGRAVTRASSPGPTSRLWTCGSAPRSAVRVWTYGATPCCSVALRKRSTTSGTARRRWWG